MKALPEKALLKETIEFNGSLSELKERITSGQGQKFKFEWVSEYEFKISPKISFGTFMSNSGKTLFDGIKGYGKLTESEKGRTKIDLVTKHHIEIYVIGIIPILAITATFLSGKEVPFFSIFLFPVIILWFWYIYRIQEKILFNRFRNYIKPNKN